MNQTSKNNIEDKFFNHLWKELSCYDYVVKINQRNQIYCVKNDFEMLPSKDNATYANCHNLILTNVDCFKEHIKQQRNYTISGFSEFNISIIKFYKKLKENEKLLFQEFIHKVFLNLQFRFLEICDLFSGVLTPQQFVKWLDYIPAKAFKVHSYPNIKEINQFIEKKFAAQHHHCLLLALISKRTPIIAKNERASLHIRDFLIAKYNNDIKILKQYSNQFPALELYIQSQKNNQTNRRNYLENRYIKECFHIEINIEKMKAVLAVPSWTQHTYKNWIDLLLKKIYQSYDCINSIKTFYEKDPTTQKKYISVYISKDKEGHVHKKQIEQYIMNFFNSLKDNYSSIGNNYKDKLQYLEKWYNLVQLETNLSKKNTTSSEKTVKI